jgi:hypothetical protein
VDVIVVVGDFGGFVEGEADAVADELVDDAAFFGAGKVFDGYADGRDRDAGAADGDRSVEAFEGDVNDELLVGRDLANTDHAAAVTEIAVEDAGGVDVEDVSFLEGTLIGDAVTDDFVERGANGFGVGGLSIAERSGGGASFSVEFAGEFVEL